MHKKFDEKSGRSGSDDENSPAPNPTVDGWGGDDDDEPPAAGAVMVEEDDEDELVISMAPKAEPTHRAEPQKVAV